MLRCACIPLLFVVLACDSQAPAGSPEAAKVEAKVDAKVDAKVEAKVEARDGARDEARDKGDAKVAMDGAVWAAERCGARLRGDAGERLSISCSHTVASAAGVTRQEIALVLRDFKGAGDYEVFPGGSHYVSVGIDTKAAAGAADEAEQTKVVTDSIAGSKIVSLMGTKVTVTAVSDTAIDGTFSRVPPAGMEGPALSDGRFHAIIKK